MTGREAIRAAFLCEPTGRAAWTPFVGIHGGYLAGATARDYLQRTDLIVEGLSRAFERYRPDGLPVVFDLQIEAEILGCSLAWADTAPPSVVSHPLAEGGIEDLPAFSASEGRYPLVFEALGQLRERFGDAVAWYGLVTGPFTLASHLRGAELFVDLLTQPGETGALVEYTSDICRQAAEAYVAAGADVIAVVDPMTSQISPDHFAEFASPGLERVFEGVHSGGALSALFVCGDATRNFEAMCKTGAHNVSIDENIDLGMARRMTGAHGKSLGGNLKLTAALLLGSEADCQQDTLRCLDAGGTTGFVLAPGCDLPFDTPPANLEAVAQLVHKPYEQEVVRSTCLPVDGDGYDDIVLPAYDADPAVYVDVVTLDSASCAPCHYMLDTARRAASEWPVRTVVREHKIRTREGIGHMHKLGVSSIPTICIDGRPAFESQIPDVAQLRQAIAARRRAKRP